MARRSTKRFEYGKGIYYFNINKGYNSSITIKRTDKKAAILAYESYVRSYKNVEWLGKWDGKKFIEDSYDKVAKSIAA